MYITMTPSVPKLLFLTPVSYTHLDVYKRQVLNATLPKEEHKERDIWTAETLSKAMKVCDDPILSLALNLAFSCSLRIGEMLGLTWDCIDIAPQSIENGSAYILSLIHI